MRALRWIVLVIVAGVALTVDQLVKFGVIEKLSQRGDFSWFWFFRIRFFPNEGVAFGIPLGGSWLVVFFIIVFIVLLALYLKYLRQDKLISVIALAFVLGGALSNIIDRIRLGYVVDYIGIWISPIFNLADIFIIIGVLLLIWRIMVVEDKNSPEATLSTEE